MNFSLSPESVSAWREGHVMNDIVFNLGCCCPGQGTEEVFSYIEVIYKDGNRHYFYENQTGFDRFEKDFYDKRFTSFHEFWTTEELAEEKRDLFSFRYYVRRPESSYTKLILAEMDELKAKLTACCPDSHKTDRLTQFHHYDRSVNYHDDDALN